MFIRFVFYKANFGSWVETGLMAKAGGWKMRQETIAMVPLREPETLVHGYD